MQCRAQKKARKSVVNGKEEKRQTTLQRTMWYTGYNRYQKAKTGPGEMTVNSKMLTRVKC